MDDSAKRHLLAMIERVKTMQDALYRVQDALVGIATDLDELLGDIEETWETVYLTSCRTTPKPTGNPA
jgi:hypothetical protein